MKIFVLCVFLSFISLFKTEAQVIIHKLSPEQKEKLISIKTWLDSTGKVVFNFWKTKSAINNASNGFYGDVDLAGNASLGVRNSIQQARHLWAFSAWYRFRDQNKNLKEVCFNQYKYFITHFYDSDGKEFYLYDTDKSTGSKMKRLYNTSFGIYSLAQYYLTFKDDENEKIRRSAEEALIITMKAFIAMDKRCHDPIYKGYQQIPVDNLALNETALDGGDKENNTHIHIMEALTTLYEAYKNDGADFIFNADEDLISQKDKDYLSDNLRERLDEMLVYVITKKMCVEKEEFAFIKRKFNRDWTAIDNSIFSYGHDIETAWLMIEALKVLGTECSDEITVRTRAGKLIKNVFEHGMEQIDSGYACIALGNISNLLPNDYSKDFWQHFEAILGLYCGVRLCNDAKEQNKYIERINSIITYLEIPFNDGGLKVNISGNMWEYEWRNILGNEWKASYHTLRSFIFAKNWITKDLN
jgi:mannobiose 2-epimerase